MLSINYTNNYIYIFFIVFLVLFSIQVSALNSSINTSLNMTNQSINTSLENVTINETTNQTEVNLTNQTIFADPNGEYKELGNEANQTQEEITGKNPELKGDIIAIKDNQTNITNYYYELKDPEEDIIKVSDSNVSVKFSDIEYNDVIAGLPITVYQEIILINDENKSSHVSLNLWNHVSKYLKDVNSVKILDKDAELISDQPAIYMDLAASEQMDLVIVYEYPPVKRGIICKNNSLEDILPEDAAITRTELPLNTIVDSYCNIELEYKSTLPFENILIELDNIDKRLVESVYFTDMNRYLNITNDIIKIPSVIKNEIE